MPPSRFWSCAAATSHRHVHDKVHRGFLLCKCLTQRRPTALSHRARWTSIKLGMPSVAGVAAPLPYAISAIVGRDDFNLVCLTWLLRDLRRETHTADLRFDAIGTGDEKSCSGHCKLMQRSNASISALHSTGVAQAVRTHLVIERSLTRVKSLGNLASGSSFAADGGLQHALLNLLKCAGVRNSALGDRRPHGTRRFRKQVRVRTRGRGSRLGSPICHAERHSFGFEEQHPLDSILQLSNVAQERIRSQ